MVSFLKKGTILRIKLKARFVFGESVLELFSPILILIAWQAVIISMERTERTFPMISLAFLAAMVPIETRSSMFAEVGIESTEAGWARILFSETRDAVVY